MTKKAIFFLFSILISFPIMAQGQLNERPTQSVEEGKVAQGLEYLKALTNKHERLKKAIKIGDAESLNLMYKDVLTDMDALLAILNGHQNPAPKFELTLNQVRKFHEMFYMAGLGEDGKIAPDALEKLQILQDFMDNSTELLQAMKPVETRRGARN